MLEALVVVSIIAITAALAAPALSRSMAVRRANESTHDVVRMGALARSEAMMYGRAHLLLFQSDGDGVLTVWRGRSDRCNGNLWFGGTIVDALCTRERGCVERLSLQDRYNMGSHHVELASTDGVVGLCYQPNGELYTTTSASNFSFTNVTGGRTGVRFSLTRFENGSNANDVVRSVVFPYGGPPRIQR